MLLVERGSRFSGLHCAICHSAFRTGDRILPSYRQGKPRAIHAHSCVALRAMPVVDEKELAQAA
jgi:hypothetical protein